MLQSFLLTTLCRNLLVLFPPFPPVFVFVQASSSGLCCSDIAPVRNSALVDRVSSRGPLRASGIRFRSVYIPALLLSNTRHSFSRAAQLHRSRSSQALWLLLEFPNASIATKSSRNSDHSYGTRERGLAAKMPRSRSRHLRVPTAGEVSRARQELRAISRNGSVVHAADGRLIVIQALS